MEKRTSLIFVGLLFILCTCVTDDGDSYKEHFTRYYGADGDHYAADMVVNADGSIVILGTAEFPANSGVRRIYLTKADKDGNTLWEKVLGDFTENAKDIEPIAEGTYAGGYFILSNTVVDELAGTTAIKVLRVDADGDKIGTDSLFLNNLYQPSNFGSSITVLSDGGFIVAGNTTDIAQTGGEPLTPTDQTDILSLRYDESFIEYTVWDPSFGGGPEEMGIKVFEISPSKFFFAGYTNRIHDEVGPALNDFDYLFVELGSNGSPSGLEFFKGSPTEQEKMTAFTPTVFGDYFGVGSVIQPGGTQRIFISRTPSSFLQSDLSLVENDFLGEGAAIAGTMAAQVLVAGNIATAGGTRNIWVTKLDRDFVVQPGFPRTFGAAGNDDTASAIAETPDGDIVILGTMSLINQNKIALIKIKTNGGF